MDCAQHGGEGILLNSHCMSQLSVKGQLLSNSCPGVGSMTTSFHKSDDVMIDQDG